jgi:hypothetical protein
MVVIHGVKKTCGDFDPCVSAVSLLLLFWLVCDALCSMCIFSLIDEPIRTWYVYGLLLR